MINSTVFRLQFDVTNDAFRDDPEPEIARILHELADKILDGDLGKELLIRIFDANGNRIGFAVLEE